MPPRGAGRELVPVNEDTAPALVENYRSRGIRNVWVRRSSWRNLVELYCSCTFSSNDKEHFDNHFKGYDHVQWLACAEKTLLKPNGWPFDDRFIFFDGEQEGGGNPVIQDFFRFKNPRLVGIGQIAARVDRNGKLVRSWCEWLGNEHEQPAADLFHDYAIATFRYTPTLGMRLGDPRPSSLCGLCDNGIYEGDDCSTPLKYATFQLACLIQNPPEFSFTHVSHTSCLILWILMRESSGKTICCPCCYGYGEGKQIVQDKQLADHQSKLKESHEKWLLDPEETTNNSIGLKFMHRSLYVPDGFAVQQGGKSFLRFYRVEEKRHDEPAGGNGEEGEDDEEKGEET